MPNVPLDMKLLENMVMNDEESQLEIIPERNVKFQDLTDYDLEEKLKAFRKYIRELPIPNKDNLHKVIEDIEREKKFRSMEKTKQVLLGNTSKNNCDEHEGLDNDKNRVYSGEQAGPSRGLRSRSKLCNICSKRLEPPSFVTIGTGKGWEALCNNCQKQMKDSELFSPKEDAFVELFSSEDEEDQNTRSDVIDCKVLNHQKGYGLRSAVAPRMEGIKIAYPSRDDPDAVEVHYHDLHRLEPLEFLNDTVIDFYIKYIQRPDVLKLELKNKFHFFNSFFYKKLSDLINTQNKKQGTDLSKLRKWTKGTNIFEKDYLFIPIHDKWHWSLAIVCHPGATSEESGSDRCILHLDSMSPGHKSSIVFRFLRNYLVTEWEHQAEEDGTGLSFQRLTIESFSTKKVPVPQQENESDCGLFLLHYLELFLKIAPTSLRLSDVDDGELFGKSWFKPSEASGLRKKIRELLQSFFEIEATKATVNAEINEVMPTNLELKCTTHLFICILAIRALYYLKIRLDQECAATWITSLLTFFLCLFQRPAEPAQQLHVVDTSEVRSLDTDVDLDMDTADISDSPKCVEEIIIPETSGKSVEPSVGVSAPTRSLSGCLEQHMEPCDARIDTSSSAPNCSDAVASSGFIETPRSRRPVDLDTCVSRKKMPRVGSVDDIEEMHQLHQLNCLDRDLDGTNQREYELVVDLPIREDLRPTNCHV